MKRQQLTLKKKYNLKDPYQLPVVAREALLKWLRSWLDQSDFEVEAEDWNQDEMDHKVTFTAETLTTEDLSHPFIAHFLNPGSLALVIYEVSDEADESTSVVIIAEGSNPMGMAVDAEGQRFLDIIDGRVSDMEGETTPRCLAFKVLWMFGSEGESVESLKGTAMSRQPTMFAGLYQ